MTEPSVRALQPADAGAARAFVSAQLSGSRYESRVLEQLDAALRGDDPECRAIVAIAPDDQGLRGLVLLGTVAGAQGVVKIHALAASNAEVARALGASVQAQCIRSAGRLLVCEVADDPLARVAVHAMRELGFEEEGRIADFVRDATDLLILVWRRR